MKFTWLYHLSHPTQRIKSHLFSRGKRGFCGIEEDCSWIDNYPDGENNDSEKGEKKMERKFGEKAVLFYDKIGCYEQKKNAYPGIIRKPLRIFYF